MTGHHAGVTLVDEVVGSIPSTCHVAEQALCERRAAHAEALNRMDQCASALQLAAEMLTSTLAQGHKVFTLGNGGSAAEAQHFAAELVGRFRRQRAAYPVLALTTDSSILTAVANDYSFAEVFSRQIEAFAGEGDLLIAFSTSGESENAIRAAQVAREMGVSVVAITGERPSRLGDCADVVVQAPSSDTPTVQELHTMFTHVLCEVAESVLSAREGNGQS